ncbi:hypothetical protein Hanom_Chr14g01262311 [Helianthus anomalus]
MAHQPPTNTKSSLCNSTKFKSRFNQFTHITLKLSLNSMASKKLKTILKRPFNIEILLIYTCS